MTLTRRLDKEHGIRDDWNFKGRVDWPWIARFPWRYSMISPRSRRVLRNALDKDVVGGFTRYLSTMRRWLTRGSAGKGGTRY